MLPPARTELPALREPAVWALVLHVRAGGLGLAAGCGVRRSHPSLSTSWDLHWARLACGGCVVTYLLCGPS